MSYTPRRVAELVRPIRTAAAYDDPTSIAQRNGVQ
jgi:hypothetical protein